MMSQCWSTDPTARPTFASLRGVIALEYLPQAFKLRAEVESIVWSGERRRDPVAAAVPDLVPTDRLEFVGPVTGSANELLEFRLLGPGASAAPTRAIGSSRSAVEGLSERDTLWLQQSAAALAKIDAKHVLDLCGSAIHAGAFTPLLRVRIAERTLLDALGETSNGAIIPASMSSSIGLDIALGIEYLHHQGFVHGEISSMACFIDATSGWTARIAATRVTFGTEPGGTTTRRRGGGAGGLLAAPRAVVTPTDSNLRWLPPEVLLRNSPSVWQESVDVWSLGVVLWCVLQCLVVFCVR